MESRAPSKPPAIRIRRARPDDVPAIYACQRAAYAGTPDSALCDERLLHMQVEVFPEGQLVALIGRKIVGYAMSLIVQMDEESPWFSYDEITGGGTFNTHDPAGDTLYGADIAVDPEYRGRGVAGRLYESRRKILKRFNLSRMVAGGRIPGYTDHAGRMTAEEYVAAVQRGELRDMALNAHLKAGYRVLGVHMGYLRDEHSLDYATHLVLDNPDYSATKRRIAAAPMRRPVRKIRVCAAQFEMRRIRSWAEFEHQVDFFVETADEYHCHYLLFPELFTVQLFSTMPDGLTSRQSIAALADLTTKYTGLLSDRAKRSSLHIIGGSHPVRTGDEIHNVGHLFTPGGGIYTQDKLHITPGERDEFGIRPGTALRVFHTSHARIAIQVCYDIEFPETSRLLTLAGAEVLFVPFSTDERKAYLRVRYTAQARAVENLLYVVTAGNVGNLPQVANFLINYGQAGVYTPSDFPFPPDGIAAISDSNSEAVVITDLDLSALEQVREVGTVRHLRDRRPDLYRLRAAQPVEVIHTS